MFWNQMVMFEPNVSGSNWVSICQAKPVVVALKVFWSGLVISELRMKKKHQNSVLADSLMNAGKMFLKAAVGVLC